MKKMIKTLLLIVCTILSANVCNAEETQPDNIYRTGVTKMNLVQTNCYGEGIQIIPEGAEVYVVGSPVLFDDGGYRISVVYEGDLGRVPLEGLEIAQEHDWRYDGTNCVEICISTQTVVLHLDTGEYLVSECVTGQEGSNDTPTGTFCIIYKEQDTVLRGEGYACPVQYWMQFYEGYGLHDASWRYEYGGDIYKWDGSHGCVNLPYWMAKTIYNHLEIGDKVEIKP